MSTLTSGSITTSYQTTKNPSAFITQQRQRIKQFENSVYLNDGSEYEIELFNPQTNHILAKIQIDGRYLSEGGIVLRPGERIFLERFIDTNNKFVYRTYEVTANDEEVDSAIRNNGNIEINFFHEELKFPYYNHNWDPWSITTGTPKWNPSPTTIPNQITYTSCADNTLSYNAAIETNETGITERGSYSKQKFETSNLGFNSFSFHTVIWKLLPYSRKVYTSNELNVLYCGNCGAKRKKTSFKFCPYCGIKY